LFVKMNRLCINPHWDKISVGNVATVLDEDMKQPSCSPLEHLTFTIQTAQRVERSGGGGVKDAFRPGPSL
jgi:hypothetical protein